MRRPRILPLLLIAGALPLAAQTTGSLQGRVKSSAGASVAGATVTVSGPTLQGTRTTKSDGEGSFRVGLLPPGAYTITFAKDGLNTTKITAQVGLDKTATLEVTMPEVAAAVVEVTDTATVVDVRATTAGANFTPETFQKLPVTRDFASIAQLAPGITTESMPGGNEGFKVYGSSGAENNYVVDGINTTGVEFGSQGKQIPIEFIQEFQVKTGGYEAEYGRSMGGVVNVITKSGGNQFAGDLFLYSDGVLFKSGNQHASDGSATTRPLLTGDKTLELGFDMGGYFIKDKLWFFAAFDRRANRKIQQIRAAGPNLGELAPTAGDRDLFAFKLTWGITEGHNLVASFLGDPAKITGAVKTPQGTRGTWDGERKIGGTDFSLRYEASGSIWASFLQASRHNETNSILPGSGGGAIQMVDQTLSGAQSGGFGRYDEKTFTRDNLAGAFSIFFNLLGSHEMKAGFDLQTDKADIRRGFTGGQLVTRLQTGPDIYSHYWWTTAAAALSPFDAPSITFTSKPKHESSAYYLQDKWSMTPTLMLNVGARLDVTDVKDQFGTTVISLKDQWAPRLGVVWDFKGRGQDKVYASYSRYYEQLPLDLVIRSFSVERNPTTYNYSATAMAPDSGAEAAIGTSSSIVGSYVEPVDPDLKGAYADEFILGAETTLRNTYVFGAKYIRRWIGRAIEDGLDVTSPLGDYFIMNPGQSHPAGVTYPQAIRDYKGVELSAQRKMANHYSWQASYLWSRLDGNYEGAFQGIGGADGTGQLDPNINSAFDVPEFIPNSYGLLSGDRTHQFKANGVYEWDMGLSAGLAFQYLSGTPISRLGYHNGYGRYELFLTPRGTEGRTPALTRLDVNLAYTMKMARTHRLRFSLDITNLLNSQTTNVVDQRYDSVEGGPMNPYTWKQSFAYQAPRLVRLGIRYSF